MRAAITGMGLVLPTGLGLQPLWQHCCAQTPALRPYASDHTRAQHLWFGALGAAERALARDAVPHKLRRFGTPCTFMGVLAATQALRHAGIDAVDPDNARWNVYTAQGDFTTPSFATFERAAQSQPHAMDDGFDLNRFTEDIVLRRGMDAFSIIKGLANNLLALLSLTHRFRGEGDAFVQDESAVHAALDAALFALRSGRADLALVVSTGSFDEAWTLAEHARAGRLSGCARQAHSMRSFDRGHDGLVPGEGAVGLVLETAEHARRRGAQPLGWVSGVGCNVAPLGAELPAQAYALAAGRALRHAGLDAAGGAGVHAVLADGKGIPAHDRAEARALHGLQQALGGARLPITTVRPITGLVPTGALIDVALAVAALQHGSLPPVANLDDPQDPGLDWVRGSPRELPLRRVLACQHGLGGFAGAVVVDHAESTA